MWGILVRTTALYGVLISGIRLMGKRQIGQMEPSELVVTMLVADLAAAPVLDKEQSVWATVISIGTILLLEILLSSLSLHSIFVRKLLCGKPVILIENGKILQDNLRATRVTLDELTGYLRQKDVLDISTVQYAILETGGSLSVFPYPEEAPAAARDAAIAVREQSLPVTVISDGRIMRDNLKKTGKNDRWLEKQLQDRNSKAEEVFLMTVDGNNTVFFVKKTTRCPRQGR